MNFIRIKENGLYSEIFYKCKHCIYISKQIKEKFYFYPIFIKMNFS